MSKTKKHSKSTPLTVTRQPVTFISDARRVITRFFDPGGEVRMRDVVDQVAELSDTKTTQLLESVFQRFRNRHSNIAEVFDQHYRRAMEIIDAPDNLATNRRMLIGSYFTMEYSIESAALFNPSIVQHPTQEGLPAGAMRFILSLRATGEGHVSSIVFRTGVIYSDHMVQVDPPSRFTHRIRVLPDKQCKKALFRRKLKEVGVYEPAVDQVLEQLDEDFTTTQLEHAITAAQEASPDSHQLENTVEGIRWLAQSNYQLKLPSGAQPSEMVIFPQTSNESHGIEDLRMVRFVNDDKTVTYYGTFTAYNGVRIMPQLIETNDFLTIGVHTLNGSCVQNKGMALFPRCVGGQYIMCSRIDGENLYIMHSDIPYFWDNAERLQTPQQPWEFVQIGNCGSPVETPEGWLMLTHGVGPMRTYSIGAMLLDLDDPQKVIGMLDEPLIIPSEQDRDGYVPNVVYTCGTVIHNGQLHIPYATSDTVTRFAMTSLDPLLNRLMDARGRR